MPNPKPVTILVVEDDPGHARLIQKNLRRAKVMNDVVVIPNGREALDYIRNQDNSQQHPALLVLLDMHLPEMGGLEVLQQIKNAPETRSIPVIMLSSVDEERKIEECYKLGCNAYITKPMDYETFAEAVRQIGIFISLVKVPGRPKRYD